MHPRRQDDKLKTFAVEVAVNVSLRSHFLFKLCRALDHCRARRGVNKNVSHIEGRVDDDYVNTTQRHSKDIEANKYASRSSRHQHTTHQHRAEPSDESKSGMKLPSSIAILKRLKAPAFPNSLSTTTNHVEPQRPKIRLRNNHLPHPSARNSSAHTTGFILSYHTRR